MARDFAGGSSTDMVEVTNYAAISDLADITISWWAFQRGDGSNGIPFTKLGNFNFITAGGEYQFYAQRWTTDGSWVFPRTLNAWTHYVLTYSNGATTNNPLVWRNNIAVTVTQSTVPIGPLVPNSFNFRIGNSVNTAFDGSLAEVGMWNRLFDAAAVANVFANGPTAESSGLVAYIPNCGAASPEPNPASPANTGTVTGTKYVLHPTGVVSPCSSDYARLYMRRRRAA